MRNAAEGVKRSLDHGHIEPAGDQTSASHLSGENPAAARSKSVVKAINRSAGLIAPSRVVINAVGQVGDHKVRRHRARARGNAAAALDATDVDRLFEPLE